MSYKRDDEALRQAIETHSVEGMDVLVPIFGQATIIEQGGTGPVRHITPDSVKLGSPMVYYRVKAKKPIPFQEWLRARYLGVVGNHTNEQWHLPAWEAAFKSGLPIMPDYQMKKLESGGTLSIADMEYDSLIQRGCIDQNNNVSCYTFWSTQTQIAPEQLKRGELVEYEYQGDGNDSEKRSYSGSIVGFSKDKKVAYLELFTPIPYLDAPNSIWSEGIQPSFHSSYTHALGYGAFEALELASEESGQNLIPPGTWDEEDPKDRYLYTLKEFIPLSMVEEVCKAAYGNEPHCLWQSLILYVIPIHLYDKTYRGIWHPLPEKVVQIDAVISYEDEDEG